MTKDFIYYSPSMLKEEYAKKRAKWILEPINKHHKRAKKVLELGVGIGSMTINFPKKWDIYGLDNEKKYTSYYKKRIKRGKFFVSSTHNFKINEEFDVIIYDSINFLKNFNQWKSTFKTVFEHLNGNGLFIFDMYTPKILKDFKHQESAKRKLPEECFLPVGRKFPKGYFFGNAILKNNILIWDFKIFEKIKKGTYQIHEYNFKEIIYPIKKVKAALSPYFKILETKLIEENRRILFVCKVKE